MITTLDLAIPAQLTLALVPDLVLMGGAMILLLWAAWRPESDTHQRNVGLASIVLAGITMVLVLNWANRFTAGPGPIAIDNFTFKSPVVMVKPGTTVTWTNGDDIPHTVVSKDGLFKSKVLDTGDRFSFTFAKAGQFGYFCSLHPHMTGTIVVKA